MKSERATWPVALSRDHDGLVTRYWKAVWARFARYRSGFNFPASACLMYSPGLFTEPFSLRNRGSIRTLQVWQKPRLVRVAISMRINADFCKIFVRLVNFVDLKTFDETIGNKQWEISGYCFRLTKDFSSLKYAKFVNIPVKKMGGQ